MPLFAPSIRAIGLALVLASLPGLAAPASAQRSPEDARTIDTYRITMPVLRRVLPIGTIRENAILIEQNDAEIRHITQGDRS